MAKRGPGWFGSHRTAPPDAAGIRHDLQFPDSSPDIHAAGSRNADFMIRHGATLVFEGAVEGYEFSTLNYKGFRVHDIKVVGPIDLKTRIPLYHETLRHSVRPYFFCIVDNAAGFDNDFTYDDIQVLDRILIDHGITRFYGATITMDDGYTKLVKLAQTNMDGIGMEGEVIEVMNRASAETFISQKIDAAARGGPL